MQTAPFYYDYINRVNASYAPSTIHAKDTRLAMFFKRYLMQEALSRYEWTLPENWDRDYFLYSLYSLGYVAVVKTSLYGVVPQHCSLTGYNVFYRPTIAQISNPIFRRSPINARIGIDCELIKLQPDYGGVSDLVDFYGDVMAVTAETAMINTFNSRLSYVFSGSSKTMIESLKKMYDNVAAGEPAVFVDKGLYNDDGSAAWDTFAADLRNNFIAPDLLELLRRWEVEFLTKIGINNANTDKRERLLKDEVNANNEEVGALCGLWLRELQDCIKRVRKMFGYTAADLDVKLPKEEHQTEEVITDD